MLFRLSLVAIAITLVLLSDPSLADTFIMDGTSFHLPLPKDFCFLSRDSEAGQAIYEQTQKQYQNDSIIALAASCRTIEHFDAGTVAVAAESFQWGMHTPNGIVTRYPDHYSREQVLNALSSEAPYINIKEIDRQARITEEGTGGYGAISKFGVIDRDKNAIYVGVLLVLKSAKFGKVIVSEVTGGTLINNHLIICLYSEIYHDNTTYSRLLSRVKGLMSEAVRLNTVSTSNP